MAWDRGYYYQTERINGRVVRQYVGKGEVAELIAQMDAIQRQQREAIRSVEKKRKAYQLAIEDLFEEFERLARLAARLTLEDAGYHQHNRGQWRRRRGNSSPSS